MHHFLIHDFWTIMWWKHFQSMCAENSKYSKLTYRHGFWTRQSMISGEVNLFVMLILENTHSISRVLINTGRVLAWQLPSENHRHLENRKKILASTGILHILCDWIKRCHLDSLPGFFRFYPKYHLLWVVLLLIFLCYSHEYNCMLCPLSYPRNWSSR